MKLKLLNKKLMLAAFLIPAFVATVVYQLVWVEDARVRTQWTTVSKLTMEQEQDRRWREDWPLHLLVLGLPSGLIGVTSLSVIATIKHYWSSRKSG